MTERKPRRNPEHPRPKHPRFPQLPDLPKDLPRNLLQNVARQPRHIPPHRPAHAPQQSLERGNVPALSLQRRHRLIVVAHSLIQSAKTSNCSEVFFAPREFFSATGYAA
jgi:hypothetical protein